MSEWLWSNMKTPVWGSVDTASYPSPYFEGMQQMTYFRLLLLSAPGFPAAAATIRQQAEGEEEAQEPCDGALRRNKGELPRRKRTNPRTLMTKNTGPVQRNAGGGIMQFKYRRNWAQRFFFKVTPLEDTPPPRLHQSLNREDVRGRAGISRRRAAARGRAGVDAGRNRASGPGAQWNHQRKNPGGGIWSGGVGGEAAAEAAVRRPGGGVRGCEAGAGPPEAGEEAPTLSRRNVSFHPRSIEKDAVSRGWFSPTHPPFTPLHPPSPPPCLPHCLLPSFIYSCSSLRLFFVALSSGGLVFDHRCFHGYYGYYYPQFTAVTGSVRKSSDVNDWSLCLHQL